VREFHQQDVTNGQTPTVSFPFTSAATITATATATAILPLQRPLDPNLRALYEATEMIQLFRRLAAPTGS
jgi:hypothetical protein